MSPKDLENAIRALPERGKLVKDRPQRQIWRFDADGSGFYLKFYPRAGNALKRLVRGSPAMREFLRLQWLQKAQVPAPHPEGILVGFQLGEQLGDAVIMSAIEPAVPLDQYLNQWELKGLPAPDHLKIAASIRACVKQLAKAGLGHSDLHLGNFLWKDGQVFLLDAHAVHRRGLRLSDLLLLGHSVNRYATQSDYTRAWEDLGPGSAIPRTNKISPSQWRRHVSRTTKENEYFSRISGSGWSGFGFRSFKYPRPWSRISGIKIEKEHWTRAWDALLGQIETDQLEVLKRSRSGDVLTAEIVLDGRPINVIIKRPKRKYWWRYLNEIGRGTRARRAWHKAWSLVFRDIPTAWPMLMMEKRVLGYATDALIVFERIDGINLAEAHLDEMEAEQRRTFFFRAGRLLRRLETMGLYHWDAKASNFIVAQDPANHPTPVLVDVDGIRRIQWTRSGIDRLLRSMRQHPQYTPDDSLWLCKGYAPHARIEREESVQEETV